MKSVTTKVEDETYDKIIDECDYPDRKKSNVSRDALRLWLSLENPEEVLREEIDEDLGLGSHSGDDDE